MTELTNIILLPGLDGTGRLFQPLLDQLPPEIQRIVVTYPPDHALNYDDLLPFVLRALPTSSPFIILAESFSGPLAVMATANAPTGLRGVILCASFIRNPLFMRCLWLRHLVCAFPFRLVPSFLRNRFLLGRYASAELRHLLSETLSIVPPRILAHRVRALLNVDVRPELRRCAIPVLYLQGTHDRIVRRRNVADIITACPHAEIIEIPAPHLVLQTQPAAAATAISGFLHDSCPAD